MHSIPLLVLIMLWLAGCSAALPAATQPPLPTSIPPTPTALPITPTPTQTAPAPTHTATPTPTLTSLPTPSATPTRPANAPALTAQLIRAAENGDTPAVLKLLAEGAELNGRDALGRTAVMAATHGNRVETVRALIQAGADINIRDNRLDNPFLYAGAEGLLEILKLTIDAKADTRLTNRFGGTALIPAAERGHIEIIKELLTRTDVDINHINNLGWTALLEAIILGKGDARHVEVVRILVDAGANVNLADSGGVTPLAHARQRGYTQMVEILKKAGAR